MNNKKVWRPPWMSDGWWYEISAFLLGCIIVLTIVLILWWVS